MADEKPANKNLDNVPGEKPSNAKALGKSNYGRNYWNILPGELFEKILFCAIERSVNSKKSKPAWLILLPGKH